MLLKSFPDKERFKEIARSSNVVPVCAEILADAETPVSILGKFYSDKSSFFLLESVEGGERWARYSFLGLSARTRVEVYRENVEITENSLKRIIPHNGDPLGVLRDLMKNYRAPEIAELPRFWGGLVGYLTYEMVSFFEKIPNRLPAEKPMASFIIPDALMIFDNVKHTITCVAIAFTEGETDLDALYERASDRVKEIIKTVETPRNMENIKNGAHGLILSPVISEDDFRQKVEKTKEYIRCGDIIQSVISQKFTCDAPHDLTALYRAQRYINPSPYMYFMHLGETVLVGSSPETMVRLENRTACLRPIAGTRPRGETEQEDRRHANNLLQDEKEKAEHLMLVDLGRNDLGRVAKTGTVQVTDLMIVERYSHVMHLVSNIVCDLDDETDAFSLIKATFPAGTLSGAPKVRAMQIIDEMEQEPRGPYGGCVGYVSFSGNMDFAITIRTACVENGRLTVRAGAGIVADSVPETERVETVNKAMSVQKALELVAENVKKGN